MLALVRVFAFLVGLIVVGITLRSAVVTLVLPRSVPDALARVVFRFVRRLFDIVLKRFDSYDERDRIMAVYAPVALLMLLPTWLLIITLGFTAMFWACGVDTPYEAFATSGSSLLTLGFRNVSDLTKTILAFIEATIGLILVALLIAYLPTMYSAFSRRELRVSLLEVRAGAPPSAVELLLRYHRLQRLDQIVEIWPEWEVWFAELDESHTSLAALSFFRSQQPQRSWVTAAGTVLDAAALATAAIDMPQSYQAQLCIRAGYLALRDIADFFQIPYPRDPTYPSQPISITQDEFNAALDTLEQDGVPLRERQQAWIDYAGWRVNYDIPLLALAELTMAPVAPWTSDRSVPRQYAPFAPRRNRKPLFKGQEGRPPSAA